MYLGSAAEVAQLTENEVTLIQLRDMERRLGRLEDMKLDRALGSLERVQTDMRDLKLSHEAENEKTNKRIDRNTQAVWGLMIILLVVAIGLIGNLIAAAAG